MDTTPEVLIAGAGPTGLLLALELCRHGIRPRVVDALAGPSPLSRAVAMHARTLELLDRHGLARQFVAQGEVVQGIGLRRQQRLVAVAPLGNIGQGLSPFPFVLIISQDRTEGLLRDALATYGVQVEWNTSIIALTQAADGITATLQKPDAAPETVRTAYVAGCDGAHSAVRHALGISFPGGTYDHLFFVADTLTENLETAPGIGRVLEISLAPRTFYGYFPLIGGRTRIIGLLPAGAEQATATFADVQPTLEAVEGVRVRDVSWFSTYRVHHRVAEQFRQERAFLLGDAGHVHSPVGGQGMNTGLGDAVNLGWKLAAVLRGTAPQNLLASYEAERIPFAQQLVATTDRAFTTITNPSPLASFVRTQLAPRLLPLALRIGWVRRLLFRTASQIGIAYPQSPLSQGHASGVRLPWAPGRYDALRQPGWQLLSIGPARAALAAWCQQWQLPLRAVAAAPGETAGTVYLVRPDGYVGLVAPAFSAAEFDAYAARWLSV